LAALMCIVAAGPAFTTSPAAQDAFGKLALGTLTALAALIQQQPK
jgi:hypothetical protein